MSDSRPRSGRVHYCTAEDTYGIRSMHDILSDWERQAILYALQEQGHRLSVGEIAAYLVGWRRETDQPAQRDDDAVADLRERLPRKHLLKMDEFGVLRYDSRTDAVRLVDGMEITVDPPWRQPEESIGFHR